MIDIELNPFSPLSIGSLSVTVIKVQDGLPVMVEPFSPLSIGSLSVTPTVSLPTGTQFLGLSVPFLSGL